MRSYFEDISIKSSIMTTKKYSTSFSLGIQLLGSSIRKPVYAIYGFVRFADEIVDTFNDQNQIEIFNEFRRDTYKALERGFSMNPILNSFQKVVKQYDININLIDTFLDSMEMDLNKKDFSQKEYEKYILGSAEVVGLMCLKIFTNSEKEYESLKPAAMSLGSAFQKVNFLRDLNEDYHELGRIYFPGVNFNEFENEKSKIEADIEKDFDDALDGIRKLRPKAKLGVYAAYIYYRQLLFKIRKFDAQSIQTARIRIPNHIKLLLTFESYLRFRLNII